MLSLSILLLHLFLFFSVATANFITDTNVLFGNGRAVFSDDGSELWLSLDNSSGSGIESKNAFIFGKFDVKMMLVPGDSAGTVATFYLSSLGPAPYEIDLEFVGNVLNQPYTLSTNIITQGTGGREQQFILWFDPTADFHLYTVLWNPQVIAIYVDGILIRAFQKSGIGEFPYPEQLPMKVRATIWYGGDWATGNGRIKTDWSKAPFVATYRDINVTGCVNSDCGTNFSGWMNQLPTFEETRKMQQIRRSKMVYNYCLNPKTYKRNDCSRELNTM